MLGHLRASMLHAFLQRPHHKRSLNTAEQFKHNYTALIYKALSFLTLIQKENLFYRLYGVCASLRIHVCTVSFRMKSAIYNCHSVVVYRTKPLHCSFTVWWFSGALKSSRLYFSTKTSCLLEQGGITARSFQCTKPTGMSPTVN